MNVVPYERRAEIYQQALDKWGMDAQAMMCIEEMSELTKEICKARRGKYAPKELADEIADVTIMCEQMRLMFGINDLVCEQMDFKIARLLQRINNTKEEKTMKIFISQPMRGKTDEEIQTERNAAIADAQLQLGNEDYLFEVLDTFFKDYDGNALQFLGKSIMALGEADVAYFCKGWEDARGCMIEHACARTYGVRIIEATKNEHS